MNDPLITRFADACGAVHPLHLRVGLAEGGVLAEGCVHQPFTLLGRDDACDVTLNDPDVNPRHAWLQVVGGRVFALDLGSRGGLNWPDGRSRSGWLDVDTPVRVGPFQVQLSAPVSPGSRRPCPDPLAADPKLGRSRPLVQLDFRNGKRAKDRWSVNRAITLVGRSDQCKLNLHSDEISSFHCGLVLTPSGLWVVDLSGRGVVVNGERMRVAPLGHGAELWIGKFLIACHYPGLGETPSAGRPATLPAFSPSGARISGPDSIGTSSNGKNGPPTPRETSTRATAIPPPIAEDEVPLGGMPAHDPASGLPSSHIMCDAFQLQAASGPPSAPILVSGSCPTPPQVPTPVARPDPALRPVLLPESIGDLQVAPLLRQLSQIQCQMFEQFQLSLLAMMKLVDRTQAGRAAEVQRELTRIQDLNAELAKLQAEVTRQVVAQTASRQPVATSDSTPLVGAAPVKTRVHASDAAGAIEEWVQERIGLLQKERTTRWTKLAGMFAGSA